jgi:hypothetical protein
MPRSRLGRVTLTTDEGVARQLAIPSLPQFGAATVQRGGLVVTPVAAFEAGKRRIKVRQVYRIGEILVWCGLGRHDTVEECRVGVDGLGYMATAGFETPCARSASSASEPRSTC